MRTIGVSPILCRMFGRMGGELALEGEVGLKVIICTLHMRFYYSFCESADKT